MTDNKGSDDLDYKMALHHHNDHQERRKEQFNSNPRASDEALSLTDHLTHDHDDSVVNNVVRSKHYWMLLVAGLAFGCDAIDIVLTFLLARELQSQLSLSLAQASIMSASIFAGMAVGRVIMIAFPHDTARRHLYLFLWFLRPILGLSTTLSSQYNVLVVIRFLVGVAASSRGMAVEELLRQLPRAARPSFVVFLQFFWTFGAVLVIVVMAFVESLESLVRICEGPALVGAILAIYSWIPWSHSSIHKATAQERGDVGDYTTIFVTEDCQDEAASHVSGGESIGTEEKSCNDNESTTTRVNTSAKTTNNETAKNEDSCRLLLVWTGFSILYFGLLNISTKEFDKVSDFGAMTISAEMELPAIFLAYYFVNNYSRQLLVFSSSFLVGGMCVALLAYIPGPDQFTVALLASLGRFSLLLGSTTFVATTEAHQQEHSFGDHSFHNRLAVSQLGGIVAAFVVPSGPVGSFLFLVMLVIVAAAVSLKEIPMTDGS